MGTDNKDDLIVGNCISVSRRALAALAERYCIKQLIMFGSAARGDMTTDSDIDLLAEFQVGKAPSLSGLAALREELSNLFGREIDVATSKILNNPYRRREIEKHMVVLYEID